MVIHAALNWIELSAKYVRSLVINYSAYLHNITPRKDTDKSLDKIGSGYISNHEKCKVSQTWRCPA